MKKSMLLLPLCKNYNQSLNSYSAICPKLLNSSNLFLTDFSDKAIPAEQRITEIEEGIIPQITTIIYDYGEAIRKEFEMIRKAKEEIQIMHSTLNAFNIQEHGGTLNLLENMAEHNNELSIRILTPLDSSINQSLSISSLESTTIFKFRILHQVSPSK